MELESILRWVTGLNCAVTLVQSFRIPGIPRATQITSAIVLAILLLSSALTPNIAGFNAAAAWVALYLIPIIAARRVQSLSNRQAYLEAERWIPLTLPIWGWSIMKAQQTFFSAYGFLDRDFEAGRRRMADLARRSGANAIAARLTLLSSANEWDTILRQTAEDPALRMAFEGRAGLFPIFLRALGECGKIEALLFAFRQHAQNPFYAQNLAHRAMVDSTVLAYTGKVQALEDLLNGPMRAASDTRRSTLLAIALQRTGRPIEAERPLESLAQSRSEIARRYAAHRRQQRLEAMDASSLGPQTSAELERLMREVASYPSTAEGWMPRTTGVLIAILLGTHLWVEVLGTGERFRDLVSYGALLIDPKTAPWPATSLFTVFTANYLHINAVHLGVNVVGLWLFGRQLETEWGWRRFLIVYLLTGPLALTTVLFSYTVISGPPIVFVGASGAVMGVLGATLAVHMARWRTTAHPMRKGSIGTIIAIVLLQVVFDMTHPQVSLGGHLAGAVWGLLLATVLDRIRSR